MSPKIVDRKDKKRSIVLGAMRAFVSKGYHATKMEDIALEAGIGKGTIYEYFRKKEDLALALQAFIFENFNEVIRSVILSRKDGRGVQTLIDCMDAILKEVPHYVGIVPVFLEISSSRALNESIGFRRQVGDWFTRMSQEFVSLIERGKCEGSVPQEIDAKAFSRMMISCLDGFSLHMNLLSQPKPFLKRQMKEFKRMILTALSPMDRERK